MSFLISGCATSKKDYVILRTGIDKCAQDTMTFKKGFTPDTTNVSLKPSKSCDMKIIVSLESVGGDPCRRVKVEKGGCHYYYNGATVLVKKNLANYNIQIIE